MTGGRSPYVPPYGMVLAGLGLDEIAGAAGTSDVDAAFLAFLLAEFARMMPFDPDFYAAAYPDIAAAWPDPHSHFITHGYREGRLPHAPSCDPAYYLQRNPDLQGLHQDEGEAGLERHFFRDGHREGRTAHPAAAADAARWFHAVQATPYRLAHRTIANATVQAFQPPLVSGPPLGFRGGLVLGESAADRRLRHRRGGVPVDSFPPAVGPWGRLPGGYIYGGPISEHFGHAMAEMIHRVLPARTLFACTRLLFVGVGNGQPPQGFAALPPVMQAPLLFLGVDPADVTVIHDNRMVETLHVAEQGSSLLAGPTRPYLAMLAAYTPSRLAALGDRADTAPRLYVSRSRIRQGGTILGERYLERLLAAEGWAVLHPQELELSAQMLAYQHAETIIFAEGSACHGAELLATLGHCVLLPRRNTEAWWIEAALRPRASRLDVLPRGTPLGTILVDPHTGAPIENFGVTLMDLSATAAALRALGLADLPRVDIRAYRRVARADLAAYIAYHVDKGETPMPGTRLIDTEALAAFEARCEAALR